MPGAVRAIGARRASTSMTNRSTAQRNASLRNIKRAQQSRTRIHEPRSPGRVRPMRW